MNVSVVQKELCFGCGACAQKCPKDAIKMVANEFGFLYPIIDEEKCINCGLCKKSCPALNSKKEKKEPISKAYEVKSKYSQKCASGGIFYEMARDFIEKGGYVAGTVWNEQFLPEIVVTNELETLEKMKGSKYVQGSTGNSYVETLDILKQGKKVLYSGTPCQIAGLYKFLGKDYENLFTIEILCHAGGSPMVWQKYIDYAQRKYGKKIVDCKMQNTKDKLVLYFEDNTSVVEKFYGNEYIDFYITGRTKKDSCSVCPFMGRVRNADIIIGDIWAKWAKKKRQKGISLVILNSEKAEKLFRENDWEFCKTFDINSKKNKPLNKINDNIPVPNKERDIVLNKILKAEKFEDVLDNKKVALMNFNYPRDNFGALLLAFAMEKVVKSFGYEPYTINYYKNPITMDFDVQGPTWKFREKFLNLFGFAVEKKDLYPLNNKFDKFIFGSDIIWGSTREYVYFGDWLHGNKNLIAYAASFGQNKLPEKDEHKKISMRRFNSVSVRESSGVDICKKYADVDATWVIDPSMLLRKEDYEEIIENDYSKVPEGDYIGYYTFWRFDPYDINIELPLYNMFKDVSGNTRTFGQWLNFIKNSKYIITSSFHGVCFSLLYNKPFVFVEKPNEDNERVKSLFRKYNIDVERIVKNNKDITLELLEKEMDWDRINAEIEKFRAFSLDWLKSALEEKPSFKEVIDENQKNYYLIKVFGIKIKVKKKFKKSFLKLLSCFIFNKKKRREFKEKYIK